MTSSQDGSNAQFTGQTENIILTQDGENVYNNAWT